MSGFRPQLFPALFTVAIVLLCGGLGVWQLERLEWKHALIIQREAAVTAAPVAPPQTQGDARALEFHRIVAEGALLNQNEVLLNTIGPKGAAGFDVLTPLREADGRILFIDRGFVETNAFNWRERHSPKPLLMKHRK